MRRKCVGALGLCVAVGLLSGCATRAPEPMPPGWFADEPSSPSDASLLIPEDDFDTRSRTDEEPADPIPSDEDPYYTGYLLQPGDEIEIQIYRESDLSGQFRVTPSGDIRHPLIGAVPLAGKTLRQAEADFTRRLAQDYLVNPRVIFKMISTQSSQIVLLGEVRRPGVYPLPVGEPMTLLQAIAGAGGFTDLASPDRVRIVRRLPDGRTTTMRVRVSRLLAGRGRQQDMTLEPNDVIMVPEVLF